MSGRTEDVELHGHRISAAAWGSVCRLTAELSSRPSIVYPWAGLEARLATERRPLGLVGYGSLMNAASAARTLRPGAERRPVVAFGARRLFNYAMPDEALARLGGRRGGRARAALNVYPTGDPLDAVNGVYLEVPAEDVPALRARERGYDLRAVACLSWDARGGGPFVGHVLCAPDAPRSGERHTDDTLEPQPEYARLCRDGDASFGEAFESFYLATTFLADRRTPAAE